MHSTCANSNTFSIINHDTIHASFVPKKAFQFKKNASFSSFISIKSVPSRLSKPSTRSINSIFKRPNTKAFAFESHEKKTFFPSSEDNPITIDSSESESTQIPFDSNSSIDASDMESALEKAEKIKREIIECHRLVERMGNGVVYLGSSRTPNDHPFFAHGMEISREISLLLGCTTWSGIGKGMMEAVTLGALEASNHVAGFKIQMEAMSSFSSFVHPFLSQDSYIVCDSILARKQGFLFAGSRKNSEDKTAFVALPGGIGTLDEMFDILTLVQLKKTEFDHPVPFLIMNYDGCYDGLLTFLNELIPIGVVAPNEFEKLCKVFSTNYCALEYLADFYSIKEEDRVYVDRVSR